MKPTQLGLGQRGQISKSATQTAFCITTESRVDLARPTCYGVGMRSRALPCLVLAVTLVARSAEAQAPAYESEKARVAALEHKHGGLYTAGKGTGRLVAGSILTATGVPILILGVALLGKARKEPDAFQEWNYDDAGYLIDVTVTDNDYKDRLKAVGGSAVFFGLAQLVVGIPLLISGSRSKGRYREWLDGQTARRLRPLLHSTRHSVSLGFQLRF